MDVMPPFMIVGTKSDLLEEPHVRSLGLETEGTRMAQRLGAVGHRCFKCSALAGEGVESVFKEAVRAVSNSGGGGGAGCCAVQ